MTPPKGLVPGRHQSPQDSPGINPRHRIPGPPLPPSRLRDLQLINEIVKEGVTVATIHPVERLITQESLNELIPLIGIVLEAERAHEENSLKANRVSEAWENKHKNMDAKKLTAMCPRWMTLSLDKTHFDPIVDRVKVVELMFKLCLDGCGSHKILTYFNTHHIPPFSRLLKKTGKEKVEPWTASYILRVLKSRTVLGELESYRYVHDRPTGEPTVTPGYYPAIIDEDTFARVQTILKGTAKREGRPVRHHENIFKGLLFGLFAGSCG